MRTENKSGHSFESTILLEQAHELHVVGEVLGGGVVRRDEVRRQQTTLLRERIDTALNDWTRVHIGVARDDRVTAINESF